MGKVICQCGCKGIIYPPKSRPNYKAKYICGHHMKTKEHKERVSKNLHQLYLGTVRSENIKSKISKTMRSKQINCKDSNPCWSGNNVQYGGKHNRIRDKYGKANKCENTNCTKKSIWFEWANLSDQYLLDKKDWVQLCRSCHINFDRFNKPITINSKTYYKSDFRCKAQK